MIRYIAFLRGINVSGHRIIKMEALKSLFQVMKFKNVLTYIQSGNVIFESSVKNRNLLASKLENAIKENFGHDVVVIIRTDIELEASIKQNPFNKINLDKTIQLYVTFLSEEPNHELLKSFISKSSRISTYKMINNDIFTLYKRNKGKDPFSNSFVEKQLKVSAITRNWNVLNKILELANR